MKKFNLLKIFLIGLLCLTPISCHHLNNIENNPIVINDPNVDSSEIVYGSRMYNAFEQKFSLVQFDSICKADKIYNDLKKWHLLSSKDGETGEIINEYMYIKYSNNIEYVYRLIKIDNNTYKITKRIKK